jgi:cytochrome c oxidase subunit 2
MVRHILGRATRWSGTLAIALAGCARGHSVLRPASVEAQPQAWLIGALFGITAVVFVLTCTAVIVALMRRADAGPRPPTDGPVPGDRWRIRGVTAAVVATAVVLAVVVAASLAAAPRHVRPGGADALAVEIVGHLWWWEITYLAPPGGTPVTTANELHVPAGRPVDVYLRSADVIHSFWAPALGGKTDLVPGRPGHLRLTATRQGEFTGFCAEFCGLEHAHMRIAILVEAPEQFERWLAAEARGAAAPASPMEEEGQRVFLASPCVGCHAVRGTPASGHLGPDLTHLAARRTLAAGVVPNSVGHLAGWLVAPQDVKPGTLMPPAGLPAPELQAVVAYLAALR